MVRAIVRSWITGARPNSEARLSATPTAPGQRVPLVLARGQGELALEATGQRQHVALVRALVAELVAARLPVGHDLAGPVGQPRLGPARRRLVGPHGPVAVDGDVLGGGHAATLLARVEQAPHEGVDEGLPRRLDDVRRHADRGPRRSPSVESMSTRTTAPVSASRVEDAHLVVGEVDVGELRVAPDQQAPQRRSSALTGPLPSPTAMSRSSPTQIFTVASVSMAGSVPPAHRGSVVRGDPVALDAEVGPAPSRWPGA